MNYLSALKSAFKLRLQLLMLSLLLLFVSCEKENSGGNEQQEVPTEQVLFMYFPWSGLNSYLEKNLKDIERAMLEMNLRGKRCMVYMHSSKHEAVMFEMKVRNGRCRRDTLKVYSKQSCITADGISNVLFDLQELAPSKRYGMAVGAHGTGWLPVSVTSDPRFLKQQKRKDTLSRPFLQTRGFGSASYETSTTTFAKAIKDAGMHFDYILFDVCYMSNVETAYDLKEVTDYLIASTSEIMAYGMPYHLITSHLLGDLNYKAICDKFYDFYSSYKNEVGYDAPYGTIAVTKTEELDALAPLMKLINGKFSFDGSQLSDIQFLDGYQPHIFYDMGCYVARLCLDEDLKQLFDAQMSATVPFKACTSEFYSDISGRSYAINDYSGLTISDPSQNENVIQSKYETAWYQATHG